MPEPVAAGLVLLTLLASSALGLAVQPFLSERHRSRETTELVQLVVMMLVTFAALVLGLLTTSVKSSFDKIDADLKALSAQLIQLDHSLREYGDEAEPARTLLRSYTAAAIASTWTDEARPPGEYYPRDVRDAPASGIESATLGAMLDQIELMIRKLEPRDPVHRRLAAQCIGQFERLSKLRWQLLEDSGSAVSVRFAAVLVFWLAIVFACFGLSAPRNILSYTTITLGAVSIASAFYLIFDLDTPFGGLIAASSQTMRGALAHMSQ
jgi:hypothetical protein